MSNSLKYAPIHTHSADRLGNIFRAAAVNNIESGSLSYLRCSRFKNKLNELVFFERKSARLRYIRGIKFSVWVSRVLAVAPRSAYSIKRFAGVKFDTFSFESRVKFGYLESPQSDHCEAIKFHDAKGEGGTLIAWLMNLYDKHMQSVGSFTKSAS